MDKNMKAILTANRAYAVRWGQKAALTLSPTRKIAVLTCMDARIDPAHMMGLSEGDAHVIRNAGGRASDDAIRSLIVSYKLLGTRTWFVIHHTDCGMETFSDATMRHLLSSSLKPAMRGESGWHERDESIADIGKKAEESSHLRAARYMSFLTIDDPIQALEDDLMRLRTHPLIPEEIEIHGMMFNVRTGILSELGEVDEETGHMMAA